MPISPRVQSFMQTPTDADAQQAFEQGFSDTAMRVFSTKFPEMTPLLSAFKILSSKHEEGSAIGAFILTLEGSEVMVPAILANNQLKPLEIIYHKDTDTFVPFKKEWLDEISRDDVASMGTATEPPKTLARDVDIRNLVVPPMVGRYAYASADPLLPKTTLGSFAVRRVKQAGMPRVKLGSGAVLIDVLDRAPNVIKRAFAKTLMRNKKLAAYAFENFDQVKLLDALQTRPVRRPAKQAALYVVDVSAPPERFKEVFGAYAGDAYRRALHNGFATLDKRAETNQMILEESTIRLSEATKTGFYLLTRADGSDVQALVVADPLSPDRSSKYDKHMSVTKKPDHYREHRAILETDRNNKDYHYAGSPASVYLVITEDGQCRTMSTAPIGVELPRQELRGKLKKILDGDGDSISPGEYVFVKPTPNDIQATDIVDVGNVSVGSDGVRRIKGLFGFVRATLITDPRSPIKKAVLPRLGGADGDIIYIPRVMVPVRIQRSQSSPEIVTSAAGAMLVRNKLMKTGAVRVKLAYKGAGEFRLNNKILSKTAAAKELMTHYGVIEADAIHAVKSAEARRSFSFILASPAQVLKFAQDMAVDPGMQAMPMDPSMQGAPMDPNAGMPMDPNMQGAPMDPSMMAPPPPPPSPVDLAVTELSAGYAQQAADVAQQLAQEQQALADRLGILQQVKHRADEISMHQQVGALTPPLELPPPETLVQPEPDGVEALNAMDPAQEEALAGEMAQGMEMPMAQNAETAERLNDPAYFESTSLATLAQSPSLRDTVSEYLPAVEDTLDHLARMLLELWMKEQQYAADLGDEDYTMLEDQLRTAFNSLGALLLRINQLAPGEEPVASP